MRVALLFIVLVSSGCVASRPAHPPGTLEPPTTLQGVNDVLIGTRATIHYTDGRQPVEAFVRVGAQETLVQPVRAVRGASTLNVPTEWIAFIEVDDSESSRQGASRGAALGTYPGGLFMGIGVISLAANPTCGENDYSCLSGPVYLVLGAATAAVGALTGAALGGLMTSQRYPIIVYEGPVSRYPDASTHASSAPTRSILELATD